MFSGFERDSNRESNRLVIRVVNCNIAVMIHS
jgi:hypothetical protein